MAHAAVREYDAKQIVYTALEMPYAGHLISNPEVCRALDPQISRVVKPDQLFGKRGKLGLVGVKLTPTQVEEWVNAHMHKTISIEGVTGELHTFLAEPFVPHTQERYISLKATKTHDELLISAHGGVDIEEQWEFVHRCEIPLFPAFLNVGTDPNSSNQGLEVLDQHITTWLDTLPEVNALSMRQKSLLKTFVCRLYRTFVSRGFVSLECNPFVFTEHDEIVLLDMVAHVDTCEAEQQGNNRSSLARVKPFGSTVYPAEERIADLDSKTWASLKLTILNPHGRIWMLLGWGGASVIALDTLANKWLLADAANYGELSWNPDAESNRAYIEELFAMMFANKAEKQYLCMIWGIANFTRIDRLCKPLADLIALYHERLLENNIHILMRRGGLNDQEWLAMIRRVCEKYGIPHVVADGETYLTDIFEHISFA